MAEKWRTTVMLQDAHHQQLKKEKERTGVSMSDLIRLAVVRYLRREQEESKGKKNG